VRRRLRRRVIKKRIREFLNQTRGQNRRLYPIIAMECFKCSDEFAEFLANESQKFMNGKINLSELENKVLDKAKSIGDLLYALTAFAFSRGYNIGYNEGRKETLEWFTPMISFLQAM